MYTQLFIGKSYRISLFFLSLNDLNHFSFQKENFEQFVDVNNMKTDSRCASLAIICIYNLKTHKGKTIIDTFTILNNFVRGYTLKTNERVPPRNFSRCEHRLEYTSRTNRRAVTRYAVQGFYYTIRKTPDYLMSNMAADGVENPTFYIAHEAARTCCF